MAPYNHVLKDATNVNPFASTSAIKSRPTVPATTSSYYSQVTETPVHHSHSHSHSHSHGHSHSHPAGTTTAIYAKKHVTTPPQSVIRKFSDVLLYSSTPDMDFPQNHDSTTTTNVFFPPSTPTNKYPMGLQNRGQQMYAHSAATNNNGSEMASLHIQNGSLLSPAFSSPQRPSIHSHKSAVPAPSNETTGSLGSSISNSSSVSISTMSLPPTSVKPKKKPSKKEHMPFDVNSEDKPPYSYATLIGMSILSHVDKRLTLSQIYQWIADTFKYYKREEVGWQNSIRHNLSLNKAFIKGEKSKDGKGHFWLIKSGCEEQFLKTKSGRKSAFDEVMDQIRHNNYNHRDLDTAQTNQASHASSSTSSTVSGNLKKKNQGPASDTTGSRITSSSFNLPSLPLPASAEYRTSRKRALDDDDEEDLDEYDVTVADEADASKDVHTEDDEDNTFVVKRARISESDSNEDVLHGGPLLATKHLAITSSFSCDSNLELSPVRINTGGPLLEPITPANARLVHVNCLLQRTPLITTSTAVSASSSISRLNDYLSASSSIANSLLSTASLSTSTSYASQVQKTPTSSGHIHARTPMSTNLAASLIRTPLRKTPSTLVKRLWHNLPGYLDEFYYSPLISSSTLNLYDDDDMILRNFESPKKD